MNLNSTNPKSNDDEMKSGQTKLLDELNIWSSGLSKHSVQAIYAIIAANWATHVKPDNPILANNFAICSMGFCIAFIVVNILITGLLTKLHKERWREAEDNTESWIDDFQNRNNTKSKWPFTNKIENYGDILRYMKIFAPFIAGGFFLISLFK